MRFSEVGSCVIAGRSDATLNRGGVRLGTAEFYRVVEELPEVVDSLVVHLEDPAGGNGQLLLFVAPARRASSSTTRCAGGSPPRCAPSCHPGTSPTGSSPCRRCRTTVTGKKLELPVKKILLGRAGWTPSSAVTPSPTSTRSPPSRSAR